MGTTEPEGRPDPVVAPLDVTPEPEPESASEFELEPGDPLERPRTRRWPVEERMGRVRLLAQSLFLSAGLASALIVTHIATASPARSTTTTTTPPGGAPTLPGGPTPTTTPPTPAGATPSVPSPTATPRPPVTTTTRPPVTTTTPAPVTVTTVCTTTPSGTTLCT
ncbi:MAG TPA: hypothetical protein PLS29_05155 [Acidimicrobiales bacterium]|nr:MAG: hypothetical protein B7Z69_03840 [Actinobacteria bacterium 21-73-9]HQU26402.1 hypothetical protein [Acidimicrobiales bacterium]